MLKEFKEELKKPLTIITNMSFITGQFPTKGREAHIIPSYKKGDKSECSNYRSIFLLPNISKIIEKAMYTSDLMTSSGDLMTSSMLSPETWVYHHLLFHANTKACLIYFG